jgi:hypothetical protein
MTVHQDEVLVLDETLKPVRQHYVGFRIEDGASLLPVIARVDCCDNSGRNWGPWYSKRTRRGEFREVPLGYSRIELDGDLAEQMVELIATAKDLPGDLVARMPIVEKMPIVE